MTKGVKTKRCVCPRGLHLPHIKVCYDLNVPGGFWVKRDMGMGQNPGTIREAQNSWDLWM